MPEEKHSVESQLPAVSNGIAAMTARRFKIPGDAVNRATADLPDDERSAIRWLHAYASQFDLSLRELKELLHYDESTLYRVFTGKYEGNIANVASAIASFKALHESRGGIKRIDYIETSLGKKVWKLCETALLYQRIIFLYGDSQIGKTTALEAYAAAHNHGETIYVRMPEGGCLTNLLEQLAVSLRMSGHQKERELRRRIITAFDNRMLLVVDEVHQSFISRGTCAVRSLEFLREIYDRSKCGLVLCGTNVFRQEMQQGRHRKLLEQLSRRCLSEVQLPAQASKRDLNTICAAYNLQPAEGEALRIESETIKLHGLGKWMCFLQAGSRIAAKDRRPLSWSHVVKAHDAIRALGRGEE